MIRPKLLICAEGIIRDGETNNISVFNIFEDINPPSLPIVIPRMSILSVVERDQDDLTVSPATLRITLANQIIYEQEIQFNFQNLLRTRNIILFGGMPLTQPGILDIVILFDGNVFQTYQIQIKAPQTPLAEPPRL